MNLSIKSQALSLSVFFVVAIAGLTTGLMWYGQSQIQTLQSEVELKDAQLIIESNRVSSVQNLYNQQFPFTRNDTLRSVLAQNNIKAAQKTLATNYKRLKASGVVSVLAAFDAQGKPLVNLPEGQNLQAQALVQKVLQQQKILSDFVSDASGYPLIALSFPVYYERGRPAGVIVLAQKPDYFLSKLTAGHEKGVGFVLRNQSGSSVAQFGDVPKALTARISKLRFQAQKHKTQVSTEKGAFALIELPLLSSLNQIVGSIVIIRDVSQIAAIQTKEWVYTSVAILVFILIAMAVLYWRFNRAFAPLVQVEKAVKRMADGDLSTHFERDANNEIGHLIDSLEMMRKGLNTLTREIQSQSSVLIDASGQTVKDSDQISEVLNKTQSVLSQVSAHIQQVTSLATQINAKTDDATKKAIQASKVANEGQAVLKDAASALQILGKQVHNASEVVSHLQQDSHNIENILTVIKEIADQTNLLALNAAIEAARAGEHGRGFAVVADEVRGLASRTQTSISEIEEMIARLLQGSNDAALVMERAREQSDETAQRTSEVEQSLTQIVTSVKSVSEQNNEIASMASRQQEEVEAVMRFTETITQEAEKAVQLSQQGKERAHALAQVAQKLRSLIQHFKL